MPGNKYSDQQQDWVSQLPSTDQSSMSYAQGPMGMDQALGASSQDLLKSFGLDTQYAKFLPDYEEQYGWQEQFQEQAQGIQREGLMAGVERAGGQAGMSLYNLREQQASLASQSGIRRGRGGMDQSQVYGAYDQSTGTAGLQKQEFDMGQSKEQAGFRHQWYEDMLDMMSKLETAKEA